MYLQDCPAGHRADSRECPYPADRSRKRWTCHCVDGDCAWEVIAPTPEQAVTGWNHLPENIP